MKKSSVKRVLFIMEPAFDPNGGGIQMSTYKLGKWLASQGLVVGIFSFQRAGHCQKDFANLHYAHEAGGVTNNSNYELLAEFIKQFCPDVVINQNPYEHRIGQVLSKQKRVLILGCLRNTLFSVKNNIDAYAQSILRGPLEPLSKISLVRSALLHLHRFKHKRDLKKILEVNDVFVMFGEPNIDELQYFLPNFERRKISLIPNSIPGVARDPGTKQKRILWLGRVGYGQKRADLILPVWKRVMEQLPDWHLDIVGEGDALSDIREEIVREGLSRVTTYGKTVPGQFYQRASIFFMTSSFEGFPNTLVEAQSYGAIPVIFDSYPIARWLVEDKKNGFLIPPFDIDLMAEKIIELASDGCRARLAQDTLESVRKFEIDRVGALWIKLFETASIDEHHH